MSKLLFAALTLSAGTAGAAVWTASDASVTAIHDGAPSGVARSLSINAAAQAITDVRVNVNISATSGNVAFLGDLYIYLTNGTDLAVLANRAGRTGSAAFGYSDNQTMDVSFSSAAGPDFHTYRLTATGSNNIALNAPLTGLWEADGRLVDPDFVLDTSPRTAGLGVFTGDIGDGTWSLFVADMSTGGEHQINSWSLEITTIPEPASAIMLLTALAAGLRRKR